MNGRAQAARTAWLSYWNAMRRYHRYRVDGLEHLAARPALIVGYHGRPIARDLCMLQALMASEHGRFPRAIMHEAAATIPVAKELVVGMEFLTGVGAALDEAVAKGDHIIVTPGGTREGCRSHRHRYQVDWGRRRGYVRLALQHNLPIVPAAGHGVDDTYVGLNDGYRTGKRLRAPGKMPVWVGVGPLGLWPVSPPWPVKITTVLGAPLAFEGVDPDDADAVEHVHEAVVRAVQGLLDRRSN
ncbi:MAG: lysophospholipid acyltransferase family protein [Deltaproteobacteria bacterium]